MTRILVTGAAGFVGSHVVRALVARGAEVTATDRGRRGWDRLSGCEGIRREALDLDDAAATRAFLRAAAPEVVVHLAWYARPEDYLTSRENLGSLAATTRFAAEAVDVGCRRFVGIGTCLEYGASTRAHGEDDPAEPDTLYGACKHGARVVVERLVHGKASFAWARLFHVHGPGENPARLVPSVVAHLRRGEPVELTAGEQVRDVLRVEDAADAIAVAALGTVSRTVNVCSGEGVTLRAFVEEVARVVGRPELLRFGALPYRPGERMRVVGEPGALRRIGWFPHHATLAEGLRYVAS